MDPIPDHLLEDPNLWDHPMLLKQHLSLEPEPAAPLDQDVDQALLALARMRVEAVQETQALLGEKPSKRLHEAQQAALFKRKILRWRTFYINNLPPELIQYILRIILLTLPTHRLVLLHRLRLTSVCRYWRFIALSDSLFWNDVVIDDPYPFTRSLEFIRRAGTADLHLRIQRPPPFHAHTGYEAKPITADQIRWFLEQLSPKWNQLRSTTFYVDNSDAAGQIIRAFSLPQHHAPRRLCKFEIHSKDDSSVRGPWGAPGTPCIYLYNLFGGVAPQLKHFSIGASINFQSVPCENLVTLDLHCIPSEFCPSSEQFHSMLSTARNLRRLTLHSSGPQPLQDIRSNQEPVILPKLRHLHISQCTVLEAQFWLNHFTAPNVNIFGLEGMLYDDASLLFPYLTGRFPNVQVLALYNLTMDPEPEACGRFCRWFDSMPLVEVLKINDIPRHVLDFFMEDPRLYRSLSQEGIRDAEAREPEAVAPKLATLSCMCGEPASDIFAFVRSRKEILVPLKSIYARVGILPLESCIAIRELGTKLVDWHAERTPEEDRLIEEWQPSVYI